MEERTVVVVIARGRVSTIVVNGDVLEHDEEHCQCMLFGGQK
jgi:hypothetical protein